MLVPTTQPGDAILPARTIVILGTESDLVRLFERGDDGQCLAGGTFIFEPCERVVRGPVKAFDVIAAVSKVGPAQVRKRSRIDEATERLLSRKCGLRRGTRRCRGNGRRENGEDNERNENSFTRRTRTGIFIVRMASRLLRKEFSPASEVSSHGHEVYHDLFGEVAAPEVHVAFPRWSSKLSRLHR